LPQAFSKCLDERLVIHVGWRTKKYKSDPDRLLLDSVRRERPRGRTPEECDELAPFHCQCFPCFLPKGYHTSVREEIAALRDFDPAYHCSGVRFGRSAMSAQCPVGLHRSFDHRVGPNRHSQWTLKRPGRRKALAQSSGIAPPHRALMPYGQFCV